MRHVWLSCIVLVLAPIAGCTTSGNCVPSVNQQRFATVYHASQEIQSSIAVGVTYTQYLSILQKYATELNIAKGIVKTRSEGEMIADYNKALIMYQSVADTWSSKIKDPSNPFNNRLDPLIQSSWQLANEDAALADSIYLGRQSDSNNQAPVSCTK